MPRLTTLILLTAACAASGASLLAHNERPLSAEESDPRALGWMQGFPPPPDKLIAQPEPNYFSFPKLRWTVCHLREFLPTEQVSRGVGAPVPLEYAIDDSIDVLFDKCEIFDGVLDGVDIENSSITFKNCLIHSNGQHGIDARSSATVTLLNWRKSRMHSWATNSF